MPRGRSLVRAVHAFSDSGIRGNVMGSFLGNYRHDPGEQLGDACPGGRTATAAAGEVVAWE